MKDAWVAVAPNESSAAQHNQVKRAISAFQFFQKDAAQQIKQERAVSSIAEHAQLVQAKWKALTKEQRDHYDKLHQEDVLRFQRESAAADEAAAARVRAKQAERDQLVVDGNRTTRKEAQTLPPKKKRPKVVDPALLAKKQETEDYIRARQDTLRQQRSSQAKRRLEYLLSQGGNIFSHFGSVREDTAKYGIRKQDRREGAMTRREQAEEEEEEVLDEQEATFLTKQPETLGFGKMRDYQLEGLNWMIRLQENGVNGILADEMGLGKTLQSISVLVYMMEFNHINGPHLIVVPKSTLSNWMNEIGRWAPTLKAIRFHGDKESRGNMIQEQLEPAANRDEDRDWHVCVTTYELCNIEKSILGKFAWNYLIIDEAHRLKNEASAFSKTVRQFETGHRLLLTGTPLQNSLHELWALLNFLVPDVFQSADQFDEWFNLDIDDKDEKNKLISQLHKILRPFMLRRLKADVEKSLPPKHETILFTGMSAMQKKLYRDILIRDIDAVQGSSGSRTAILNIVMQLRKCAGHPYLFPGAEDRTLPPLGEHLVENCGKMVVLDKLLKRMQERGHRVLLFTQMTRILDLMEDYLVMRKFNYCRIDGNTSYDDREGYIDSFNAPNSEKFIFLLSTRAGGLGINLQTADIVILYDSDWNPQADLQAQDRAHRIGQKKPVQVFRLVTEHTIEEKIVERAQQKLKLDAMVVQQGRLKEKDKLSRDELLQAVRFGADKIFKSKDSSITDNDIDLILNAGKRKTEELNEKLQAADKGDLLDFKFDGSSAQTFEGVDYSNSNNALAQAKAEAEMMGIIDIGKRERKEANYNESAFYQRQVDSRPKKRKMKLPKEIRLPRMDEWQMYDRTTLLKIQEEEIEAFKQLPEEEQKLAVTQQKPSPDEEGEPIEEDNKPYVLPPLLTPERQEEKDRLLREGFSDWRRDHFNTFVKLSGKFGQKNSTKHIATELGRSESDVQEFADAFWGDKGKNRIAEHEYDRAIKAVERGEKRIEDIKQLRKGTQKLIQHFRDPWRELVFTHVNCKDKFFTDEEDRNLLCWACKFGYGQWQAVRLAIRRSPHFLFDYYLRSLPVEMIGRRCEQLMKAAEKEIEQLEHHYREANGLATEPDEEGKPLPPVELPKYHILEKQRREKARVEAETELKRRQDKVNEIKEQMASIQARLKQLNEGRGTTVLKSKKRSREGDRPKIKEKKSDQESIRRNDDVPGAVGPNGDFLPFPAYEGKEAPNDWKKPFTHFCINNRKRVKALLDSEDRKNKSLVNGKLKEEWQELNGDDKRVWREWTEWDKQRHAYETSIYQRKGQKKDLPETEEDGTAVHVPKKSKH